jgi:Sulfatase
MRAAKLLSIDNFSGEHLYIHRQWDYLSRHIYLGLSDMAKLLKAEDHAMKITRNLELGLLAVFAAVAAAGSHASAQERAKRPNIVMLMTDDTGWNDFGAYSGGGAGLGHPTPNVDRIAKEGAVFTNWYGQASCTAGRASFITGRIPIRSALSIVVAPGDENRLRKETPTIAEFFKKNGYTTYFSGKWHLGDKPDAYPTEHGFDEMKHFAAYYAGVYSYNDTSKWFHPWFPSYNPEYNKMYDDIVNLGEWEGVAGKPASMVGTISYDTLATFDIGLHQTAREE